MMTSLMAYEVQNPPGMQETKVSSLGQEDSQEDGMATHSSILTWRIPWAEGPGRLYGPWGYKEWDTTEWLSSAHRDEVYQEGCVNQKQKGTEGKIFGWGNVQRSDRMEAKKKDKEESLGEKQNQEIGD